MTPAHEVELNRSRAALHYLLEELGVLDGLAKAGIGRRVMRHRLQEILDRTRRLAQMPLPVPTDCVLMAHNPHEIVILDPEGD